ncbi:MAG: hypothetical protein ACLQQ4_14210 [Bacteroidia bacterium]
MEWNDTCNRFVGFFDIMGFKNAVQRNSHSRILLQMRNLKTNILGPIEYEFKQYISKRGTSKKKRNILQCAVKPVIFSDTILLVTNGNTEEDFNELLFNTHWLMQECFHEGIPIKGAISYGKFTADFNSSIYFGQPLIDAYQLQDELLLYGCIIDHTVEKYVRLKTFSSDFEYLKLYQTPLKTGKVNHHLLDWSYLEKHYESDKKHIANFYQSVSGKTRIYVDNTIEYLNYLI